MSAARLYTRSMPRVAWRQFSYSRRSRTSNSSASDAAYSGRLISTPRTQNPSFLRRVTKWCPMNPPAPVTRIRCEFDMRGLLVEIEQLYFTFQIVRPGHSSTWLSQDSDY